MRFGSPAYLLCVLVGFVMSSAVASGAPASDTLAKKLDFPSPVQWKVQGIEISLIGVAWGPANSPEMIARSREDIHVQRAEFYPDRPYVLALNFRARVPNAVSTSIMGAASGLGRIKNVDGDIEAPMELTQSGFIPFSGSPGVYDVRFDHRSSTTGYWDLFPASLDQKEFLFGVFSNSNFMADGGTAKLSFKIIRKDDDFVIVNASPSAETCPNFRKNFAGSVGAGSSIQLQLARESATLSGTEQYERIGKTLWLRGTVDSLGNLVIEERYPKDTVTGIFKGQFSQACQVVTGFFSKPDGSRLQPFEFREVGATHQNDANRSDDAPQQ
jgi:hypothetical protein